MNCIQCLRDQLGQPSIGYLNSDGKERLTKKTVITHCEVYIGSVGENTRIYLTMMLLRELSLPNTFRSNVNNIEIHNRVTNAEMVEHKTTKR